MSADFNRDEVAELLASCHRRCCICHKFCRVNMEVDHIVPKSKGGTGDISNAIAVCFDCHADIKHYNDSHPRGRKFRPEELRMHKEQWLKICKDRPLLLREVARDSGTQPLQALIDELESNLDVAKYSDKDTLGALFADEQYKRAIGAGAFTTLDDELKASIRGAYRAIDRANQLIPIPLQHSRQFINYPQHLRAALDAITAAVPLIETARNSLVHFLGLETPKAH